MMRLCALPLALLFIAFTAPTIAQKRGAAGEAAVLEVAEGEPLSVECLLRVEQRAEWRVQRVGGGGGWEQPAQDMSAGEERALPGAEGQVRARLTAPRARALHAGRYRCHPAAAPVTLRLLPLVSASEEPEAEPDLARPLQYYDLFQPLTLNCTPANIGSDAESQYHWKKNGTDVQLSTDGRGAVLKEKGAVLVYQRATEDDYGNYTCSIGDNPEYAWEVHARTIARLPANSNVVEGQKLSLVCKLHGKPAPRVQWRYSPPDAPENDTGVLINTQDGRFTVKDSPAGVPDGVLELSVAERADAGSYSCAAAEGSRGVTVVRVKDVYAALWPFLGICLEVFILCAIILVYEKRRTKPEMEDSDADNHDQ